MVQLIAGQNGKGKTRAILTKANEEMKTARGSIVFIDKNNEHMYELSNRIRMIDVSVFSISNSDEFSGFVSGIISQDHDIETIYIDRFIECSSSKNAASVAELLLKFDRISSVFDINLVISVSLDKEELPESLQDKVLLAL